VTIRIPDPSMGDKILNFIGKKRGLILPGEMNEQYRNHAYATARKESFWKALLRSKNTPFPENVIDYHKFMINFKEIKGE